MEVRLNLHGVEKAKIEGMSPSFALDIALLLGAASFALDRTMPANQKVEMIYANGKRAIVPPPKDIVVLRREERKPDLRRWQPVIPRFAVLALLAGISGGVAKLLDN